MSDPVQLGGGDKVPRVEAAFVLQPGARADAHDGCCVWQAQLAGNAALALEPASLAGDGDVALFDAAMANTEWPFTQTKVRNFAICFSLLYSLRIMEWLPAGRAKRSASALRIDPPAG
ncbi:MAG: hypothetical protein EOR03_02705 [Mesorhizobium sp.]|nr:MAG: hypothetical protein EOR03_02705 [Mesorhizobium sp.]